MPREIVMSELNGYQNVESGADELNVYERGLLDEDNAETHVSLWRNVRRWFVERRRASFSANCITMITASAIVVTVVTFLTVLERVMNEQNQNDQQP
jgi:hypothetical protein